MCPSHTKVASLRHAFRERGGKPGDFCLKPSLAKPHHKTLSQTPYILPQKTCSAIFLGSSFQIKSIATMTRPTLLNNSVTSSQSAPKIDSSYWRVSWFSNYDACDAGRVWERPPQPWQRPRPPGVQLPQQFTFTSFCICICVQEFSWFSCCDLPSLHCLCIFL